jgi:uncharacterized protein YceK
MARVVTAIVTCTLLSGCVAAGTMLTPRQKFSVEQRAISNAISLCEKFGHKEDTKEFTRCAEQRYDEFMIRNQ